MFVELIPLAALAGSMHEVLITTKIQKKKVGHSHQTLVGSGIEVDWDEDA